MKKKLYRVSATVVGSKYIGEFLAESAEAAEKMAWDHENSSICLCHQCSSECEDGTIEKMNVERVKQ